VGRRVARMAGAGTVSGGRVEHGHAGVPYGFLAPGPAVAGGLHERLVVRPPPFACLDCLADLFGERGHDRVPVDCRRRVRTLLRPYGAGCYPAGGGPRDSGTGGPYGREPGCDGGVVVLT